VGPRQDKVGDPRDTAAHRMKRDLRVPPGWNSTPEKDSTGARARPVARISAGIVLVIIGMCAAIASLAFASFNVLGWVSFGASVLVVAVGSWLALKDGPLVGPSMGDA
jgi:hypothetical protein